MVNKTKPYDPDEQRASRPVIIEMQKESTTPLEDAAAVVTRVAGGLRQATQTAVDSPIQVVQDSAGQIMASTTLLGRRAAKTAIKTFLARQDRAAKAPVNALPENKAQQVVQRTKKTIAHVRDAADPRIIAGGLAGLTAGEIVGGAVGGVAGAVVAGPAGAVVGAQVGGFTAGMLGLKIGADAVYDHLETKRADKAVGKASSAAEASRKTKISRFLQIKTGERLGEIVGLTSGASIGLVIAGPAGGLVGAVIGEALGGQLGEDMNKEKADKKGRKNGEESASQWLDRFGKNTAGEAASVLVAGSVGSIFGPGGRLVGHRIGLIFGKRVEWHKLDGLDHQESDPAPLNPNTLLLPQESTSAANQTAQAAASDQNTSADRPEPATITGEIEEQTVELSADPPLYFTQRQLEVLALMQQQLDTNDIAERLHISSQTVNYHKRNIHKKIKSSSSSDAAYVALELGPDTLFSQKPA